MAEEDPKPIPKPAPQPRKRPPERLASILKGRSGTPRAFTPRNTPPRATPPRTFSRPVKTRPQCTNPTCTTKDVQDDNGIWACFSCGLVLDSSQITQDLTFGEAANGAAVVQGAYVGANDEVARNPTMGASRIAGGMDSRAITDKNGQNVINKYATRLNLNQTHRDRAMAVYRLAYGVNFIQGRVTDQVAAVCLYAACRKDQHCDLMLIDFSEMLNMNVFKLGQIFNALADEIGLRHGAQSQLFEVNPEALIQRFANDLQFGPDTHKIANEAVQILKRLNRDWITVGRRPAGVCAAAILLAARMNNYRRTVREVVYTAKVADITINKRLDEFKYTDSSKLTVEEFRHYGNDLENEHDPPAFYEQFMPSKKRRKRVNGEADDLSTVDGASERESPAPGNEGDASRQGSVVPSTEHNQRPTSHARDAMSPQARAQADREAMPPPNRSPVATSSVRARGQSVERIDPLLLGGDGNSNQDHLDALAAAEGAGEDTEANDSANEGSVGSSAGQKRKRGRPSGTKNKPLLELTPNAIQDQNEIEVEVDSLVHDPRNIAEAEAAHNETVHTDTDHEEITAANIDPALSGTDLPDSISIANEDDTDEPRHIPVTEYIDPAEFENDIEVSTCLLSPAEVAVKEAVWVQENGQYLRDKQARAIKAELQQQFGTAPKKKTRVRHRQRMGGGDWKNRDGSAPRTAGEATVNMMKNRGYSTKINYEILRSIYDSPSSRSRSRSGTAQSRTPSVNGGDGQRRSSMTGISTPGPSGRDRSSSVASHQSAQASGAKPRSTPGRSLAVQVRSNARRGHGSEDEAMIVPENDNGTLPTPQATEEQPVEARPGAEKETAIEIEDNGEESSDAEEDDYFGDEGLEEPEEQYEFDQEEEEEGYGEEYE